MGISTWQPSHISRRRVIDSVEQCFAIADVRYPGDEAGLSIDQAQVEGWEQREAQAVQSMLEQQAGEWGVRWSKRDYSQLSIARVNNHE